MDLDALWHRLPHLGACWKLKNLFQGLALISIENRWVGGFLYGGVHIDTTYLEPK